MPDDVLNKIQYLCREIHEVEWSGILLYSNEGSIKDPENMIITLRDIIPMHKGDATYTSYEFTEKSRDLSGYSDKHIDYCEENEEALMWTIGHIHSHNNMDVFFSTVDTKELEDNCGSHNFYLSLIVNNKMDFEAKVAVAAKAEGVVETTYEAMDEDGKLYTITENVKLRVKKDTMITYDCKIISNKDSIKLEDKNFFEKCVDDIIFKANKPKVIMNGYCKDSIIENDYQYKEKVSSPINWSRDEDQEDDELNSLIVDFCKDLFCVNGMELSETTSLGKVLKIAFLYKNAVPDILDRYSEVFIEHFGDQVTVEYFTSITEEVLNVLDDYSGRFPKIKEMMNLIEGLLDSFLEPKN